MIWPPTTRPHIPQLMDTVVLARIADIESLDRLSRMSDVVRNPQSRPLVEEEVADLLEGASDCPAGWGPPLDR